MGHCSHGKETGEEVESPFRRLWRQQFPLPIMALFLTSAGGGTGQGGHFFEKDLNIAVAVDLIEVWRGSHQLPAALAPCSDRRFSSTIFTPGAPSGRHL